MNYESLARLLYAKFQHMVGTAEEQQLTDDSFILPALTERVYTKEQLADLGERCWEQAWQLFERMVIVNKYRGSRERYEARFGEAI